MNHGLEGGAGLLPAASRPRSMEEWARRLAAFASPVRVFIVVGGLTLAALVLLIPPFENPDEQQHLFRTFAISEGHVLPEARGDASGATIPSSLIESAAHFLGSRRLHPTPGRRKNPISDTLQQLPVPLEPARRTFVEISAFYLPTAYLPQVTGVWIGRLLHLGPVGLLLAARVLNAASALLIVSSALRIAPAAAAPILLWIALLPCSQIAFASCSADALVISTSLLFSALLLRELSGAHWTRSQTLVASCCATVFAAAKFAYLPLAVSGAARLHRRAATHLALGLGMALIAAVWLKAAPVRYVALTPGVDTQAQLVRIVAAPLIFVRAFATTLHEDWVTIWIGFIGEFGWNVYMLPALLYPLLTFSGLFSLFPKQDPVKIPSICLPLILMLSIGSTMIIALALYITWTSVGSNSVEGFQGRYLIPIFAFLLPVLSASFGNFRFSTVRNLSWPFLCITLLVSSLTLPMEVVRNFGLM